MILTLEAFSSDLPEEFYSEEFCEMSPLDYQSPDILDNMTKDEFDRIHPRRITRYLHGSFVMFHKDSIYNHFVSKYKGEHDKIGLQKFNEIICEFAEKYKGKNMMTIQNELP